MFKLTIDNTDNAAFEEPGLEIARILRDAADKVERGTWGFILRDYNGNKVGTADDDLED